MPGLRNIIEVIPDREDNPLSIRPFSCPYCQQKYTPENLNLTVIIYGVFFLISADDGHFGFTCPNCIKTVLVTDTSPNIKLTYKYFTSNSIVTADTDSDQLRYNSFPRFSVSDLPTRLQGLIKSESLMIDEIRPSDPIIQNSIDVYEANYYCGYIYNTQTTGKTFPTLWWFRKNSLEELIEFECQKKISVFPRYIYRNQTIKWCNEFCWKYRLIINYLDKTCNDAKKTEAAPGWIKEMEGYAAGLEQIDSIGEVSLEEACPGDVELKEKPYEIVGLSEFFGSSLEEHKEEIKSSYHKTVEFTDILLSDSVPFGPRNFSLKPVCESDVDNRYCLQSEELQSIFRSKRPFKGKGIPENLDEIKAIEVNAFADRKNMTDRIVSNFYKGATQQLLSDAAERFIIEYVDLAKRSYFSYGQLWHLKHNFLRQLHDSIYHPDQSTSAAHKVSPAEAIAINEAEDSFPGVKIISDDPRINQIKIMIYKETKFFKVHPGEDPSFLILGERGTGKELFAEAIHQASGRKGELVTADCGAISSELFEATFFGAVKGAATDIITDQKGYFEQAQNGTLFFDEIGNLSATHQQKLLRALQSRIIKPLGSDQTKSGKIFKSNAFYVFATNSDLKQMVMDGIFRGDLYDRINKSEYKVPPLRMRPQDIPKLARYFVNKADYMRKDNPDLPPIELTQDCMDELIRYEWPGNVRELKSLTEGIMRRKTMDDDRSEITSSDLPRKISSFKPTTTTKQPEVSQQSTPQRKRHKTIQEITAAYKQCAGNITQTAELLGIERDTVRRRLEAIGIYKKPR